MNETHVSKKSIDLLIEARWIATVDVQNQLLENHSVAIHQGVICAVLPSHKARATYEAQRTVTLDAHVLIPGLINCHSHVAMSLMRGLADDIALMPWLNQHIWPAERAVVHPNYVQDATLLACAEMLRGGITCFNDMYFYPHQTASAATQAGMRAHLGLVVMDFSTNYASDAEDYLQKGLATRDVWRNEPLISFSIAPHAPYTVANHTFEKVVTYAEQLSIGIHTHLHETNAEIIESEAKFGVRPIKRMQDLGVLGPNLVAAHCVHLTADEVDTFSAYGCHVVHCPTSNLKLGSGIAPVAKLLSAGVNVALGTDGVASNNRLDMFAEMRLSALLAKGVNEDPTLIPAQQALRMATIHAARALGLDHQLGSIEANKFADLVAVKLNDPISQPYYDPVAHLVHVCGREHVTHTWVAGELKYENGVYANIEPSDLKEIIHRWQPQLETHKK